MRGESTRRRIERTYGTELDALLLARLRSGATLVEVAREWHVCSATIYSLARSVGLDMYWVRDGVDIVCKVP